MEIDKIGKYGESTKIFLSAYLWISLDKISTVQYRPSEKKIVFDLKVSSGDGLRLILQLK